MKGGRKLAEHESESQLSEGVAGVADWLKFVENESDKKESDKKKVTRRKWKKESESAVATGGEGDEGRAEQYGILHAIVHTQIFFVATQKFCENLIYWLSTLPMST